MPEPIPDTEQRDQDVGCRREDSGFDSKDLAGTELPELAGSHKSGAEEVQ